MSTVPVIELHDLSAGYGSGPVLRGLDLTVEAGEFIAVLGPNGSGKTTLLKVLLGQLAPSAGTATVCGTEPREALGSVGYVPQHRGFDRDLPIRGRELVELGLTGARYGLPLPSRSARSAVDRALDAVGARPFADIPVGLLSGGEQQRLRIAQGLLGDPRLVLLDEPLLALDPRRQSEVTAIIDERRRASDLAVLFVTHEINPVLPVVDRVLYLVDGRAALGAPSEVLTTETLTALYGAPVEVLSLNGRLLVLAGEGATDGLLGHHHHDDAHDHDHDHDDEPKGRGPWV
jgi:zinc/manganese transport system ATP-binding protein